MIEEDVADFRFVAFSRDSSIRKRTHAIVERETRREREERMLTLGEMTRPPAEGSRRKESRISKTDM